MKKIIIAGMLATVIAGSGLIASQYSNEAVAASDATNTPQATDEAQNGSANAPQSDERAQNDPSNAPQPADGARKGPAKERPPGPNGQCSSALPSPGADSAANQTSETVQGDYTVTISGGFDTDPQDHGRPDVLIAAALGVPTEVFREAFSGVTPAGLDRGPTAEEAQRNKAALMKILEPYGITNERLDEVSNYYRYNGRNGNLWKRTLAIATPILTDGVVTGVTITNPGSGYSSAPVVTIKGPDGTITAKATVAYSQSFDTNGSLSSITLD